MIKGCAKRVVVVRDIDSNFFEEAFFIVKQGSGKNNDENAFIGEANRIVHHDLPNFNHPLHNSIYGIKTENTSPNRKTKNKPRKRGLLKDFLVFLAGFSLSAVLCTFIYY